jgi:hypothetical protein
MNTKSVLMRCPYFSADSKEKKCTEMGRAGLSDNEVETTFLTDFLLWEGKRLNLLMLCCFREIGGK